MLVTLLGRRDDLQYDRASVSGELFVDHRKNILVFKQRVGYDFSQQRGVRWLCPITGALHDLPRTLDIHAVTASWACFMISIDPYLPVPTIRRDENSLPPRTRFVSVMALSPTDRCHRSPRGSTPLSSHRHPSVARFPPCLPR